MTTTISYPDIVKNNGEPARLESHPRTRVAMIVMDYLARGLSPDEIVRHYPYLKPAEVHAAMAYYYDNEQESTRKSRRSLISLPQKHGPSLLRRFTRS